MTTARPTFDSSESLASYLGRLDAWKAQGDWVPASNGTEEPFTSRSGARLLYCFQPRSGKHAYLDLGTDLILTNQEASNLMGQL
jgi:hypothetical protein